MKEILIDLCKIYVNCCIVLSALKEAERKQYGRAIMMIIAMIAFIILLVAVNI